MDRPCLRRAPPGDCPVLSLPDAMFQPAVDPAHIQTEGTGQREAGQLLLAEDRWLLVVGDGTGTGADRPQVGRPHPRRPRRHPHPLPRLADRAEGTGRRVRHDLPACGETAVKVGSRATRGSDAAGAHGPCRRGRLGIVMQLRLPLFTEETASPP